MNLEDFHTAFQIRSVYDNSPVKTSRSEKRRIKDLRTVGCCKDQKSLGCVKAVHFRKKLIQSLLSLVIAASIMRITAFSDCIDLINKYNTGGIFLCLLKKITDTGGAHAYKHFHKFRTGKRKERYLCLSCHCLCKQGLSCSRRSHKQSALGKLGSHSRIFARIMQKIHNLLKRLLCLVLAGHIFKGDTCFLLNISLGAAFSHAHNASVSPVHTSHKEHQHTEHHNCRKNNTKQHGKGLHQSIRLFVFEYDILSFQTFGKSIDILHLINTVGHFFISGTLKFRLHCQNTRLKSYLLDLVLVYHFNKFVIGDLTSASISYFCNKTKTYQCHQKTDQKRQNRLAVFIRSLIPGTIPVRSVSIRTIVFIFVHFIPPLLSSLL